MKRFFYWVGLIIGIGAIMYYGFLLLTEKPEPKEEVDQDDDDDQKEDPAAKAREAKAAKAKAARDAMHAQAEEATVIDLNKTDNEKVA